MIKVTMKENILMSAWFDLRGIRKMPWSRREEVPTNEGFPDYSEEPRHDEPSPVHRCKDIKKAKQNIHGLIKKEISEGNYYKGCPKKK